ncbi:MAG: hypothetical protein IT425_00655 [Pirellulales bacterium]|nr:hypothetical protein [Pirellulales bacterium]
MPFFLIPTTLGVSFFLIWVFIGGMILRDGQLAARREEGIDNPHGLPPSSSKSRVKPRRLKPHRARNRTRSSIARYVS